MTPMHTLNQWDDEAFVRHLAGVFEHSPWIARGAIPSRPHRDVDHLHAALCEVLRHADREAQLQLIRAHPQLAGREARSGTLTRESLGEQGSAGLDHCSAGELHRLADLNDRYLARHGFPFVMAVKGSSRDAILAQIAARLDGDTPGEFQRCLVEIMKIARFRLEALVV